MNEKMTFAGAVKTCLKKYAQFRGVAARREYWFFLLFIVLVSAVMSTLDQLFFPNLAKAAEDSTNALLTALETNPNGDNQQLFWQALADSTASTPLSNVVGLVFLLPMLAVLVRRMRDAGFAKWWFLLIWLQLFTFIVTLLPSKSARRSA
ncbi:MAG: DUF805 domain-containing protein [Rhodoluna sp.]